MTVLIEERTPPRLVEMTMLFETVDLACNDCGYGVVRQPEQCPMCGCQEWQTRQRRIPLR
jgi:rubrerythrin